MKARQRPETQSQYVKYQGVRRRSCLCTVTKNANIPSVTQLDTSIVSIQKLSCTAGQWYFVRTRWTTISGMMDADEDDDDDDENAASAVSAVSTTSSSAIDEGSFFGVYNRHKSCGLGRERDCRRRVIGAGRRIDRWRLGRGLMGRGETWMG